MPHEKTAVQVVQELIAVHTTRREAAKKLLERVDDAQVPRYKKILEESDHAIKELMNELSQFGDAVSADVSRDYPYHQLWNKLLENQNESSGNTALQNGFEQMELLLDDRYKMELTEADHLPESLKELLLRLRG